MILHLKLKLDLPVPSEMEATSLRDDQRGDDLGSLTSVLIEPEAWRADRTLSNLQLAQIDDLVCESIDAGRLRAEALARWRGLSDDGLAR